MQRVLFNMARRPALFTSIRGFACSSKSEIEYKDFPAIPKKGPYKVALE